MHKTLAWTSVYVRQYSLCMHCLGSAHTALAFCAESSATVALWKQSSASWGARSPAHLLSVLCRAAMTLWKTWAWSSLHAWTWTLWLTAQGMTTPSMLSAQATTGCPAVHGGLGRR